ncbi:MAG: hypothetical protein EZS26_002638 [Candidatus Ordinivivax streblomastigis]|uniref:Uncharacterized protein n=1 Tax=Candidatus Ordinivivax streblomastigis TaxID=2540710 RepID=A0A5M8NY98_9BACT|nr:MAG: hypothetical protein EZS26_002638 [Candidatus Ordinivivax streblomastigis]
MPFPVAIEEISMFQTAAMGSFPMIKLNDPPGIKNYYRAIIYINGKRMPNMKVLNDELTDGKLNSSLILFDPEYNDNNNIEKGDVIRIEMQCLDKGAYIYRALPT